MEYTGTGKLTLSRKEFIYYAKADFNALNVDALRSALLRLKEDGIEVFFYEPQWVKENFVCR